MNIKAKYAIKLFGIFLKRSKCPWIQNRGSSRGTLTMNNVCGIESVAVVPFISEVN